MTTDPPKAFVAEGAHETPPIEELLRVLDAYDDGQRRAPVSAQVKRLAAAEQWILDYSAFRERVLRGALEEVAWQLEKRGHHAWLEDEAVEEAADVVEGLPQIGEARALRMRMLPGRSSTPPDEAPCLSFVPDVDHGCIDVELWLGDPARVPRRRIERGLRLGELDEATVIGLATRLVAPVLLGGVTPGLPPTQEQKELPPAESDGAPEPRQWADSGLVPPGHRGPEV
jgi:hypothetical protein